MTPAAVSLGQIVRAVIVCPLATKSLLPLGICPLHPFSRAPLPNLEKFSNLGEQGIYGYLAGPYFHIAQRQVRVSKCRTH
jgi:hypothetical protein